MFRDIMRFLRNKKGPTTTEWIVLVIALLAVTIAVMWGFREQVIAAVEYIFDLLQGFRPAPSL